MSISVFTMSQKPDSSKQLFTNLDAPVMPLWAKIAICMVVGIALAVVAPLIASQQYIATQKERIGSIAYLISPERVTALRDNAEKSADDYDVLKTRLQKVKTVNSDARFIYIMARDDHKSVRFLVDSETPGSDGYSPRNEAYGEASDALVAMFDNGRALVEGPVSDRWGSWLSVLAPIRNDAGEVVGVVGLDIPSSRYITLLAVAAAVPLVTSLLVATLIVMSDRMRRRRQETLRMRSQIVSIASHELQTPLTGILWGQETLLNTRLPEKEMTILAKMHESTITLQESIEDMMQLTGIQDNATTRTLNRVTSNLIELINNAVNSQQLPAQQKGVTITYGPNWPALVMANVDVQQIKRVFTSLISNAVKYSATNTSVVIDYEVIDGNHVFMIQDSGIGIPKEEQSKVFDGFYRASNAVKQNAIGTGMGLYASRNAIEQHGGKMWLKSEEGKGTTIYLQLPK